MVDYKYAYIIGDVLLLMLWLLMYVLRKDLRREILLSSVAFGFCGPLSQLIYLRDYWQPTLFSGWRIGLEDYLFAFVIGGITSVVYEEVFRTHLLRRKSRNVSLQWFFPFGIGLSILVLGFSVFVFNLNSIYASVCLFVILALVILILRIDLLYDALWSGLFTALVIVLFYQVYLLIFPDIFNKWWMLHNLSGRMLLGIPIEEILWAFSFGLFAGPLYEFITARQLVLRSSTMENKK